MEQLVDMKQQDLAVFVPLPGRNSRMKRCRTGIETLRDGLAPCLHSPCTTMASMVLVVVEGVLIFLLLLLDISIQDSFRVLSCWNSTDHNLTGIKLTASYIEDDLKRPMQCTSTALLSAFLLEVFLRSFVSGRHLIRNYWELFDTFITVLTFSLNVAVLASYSVGKQVSLFVILFRLWRILELLGTPLSKYHYSDNQLEHGFSTSSSVATVETYVAEQNITTLMLKIEELERELERLQTDNRRLTLDQRKLKSQNHSLLQRIPTSTNPPTQPAEVTLRRRETTCKRCINHNWTTDDLLKIACMQLSRSDSRFREDLRAAKSLEELNLPESGYSSAQRKFHPERYPKLNYGQENVMQPLELAVQLESMVKEGWLEELSEIQRISQIDCPDFNHSDVRIPVTSL